MTVTGTAAGTTAVALAVDGRRPLPDSGTWWRVESGELEVAARVCFDDGTLSAPVHAYSLLAGVICLPTGPDATVTGLPGTFVVPITPDEVAAGIDAGGDARDAMGAAIQGWAGALYGACEELSGVGRSSQVLRPGERLDLADGVSVAAATPVAWIRIR